MRTFEGFKRIAVVVVPTEEEFKKRCEKRDQEEGKEVPDHAVFEMMGIFDILVIYCKLSYIVAENQLTL